ncbi:TPA: hypothetical protein R1931_002066 [Staphylococcus delphini]|nr:hypothetical protein [Staphylococcus delphini]
MKKLLLTLTVLFVGIVLSACTDSEIKKLNGTWEGYDDSDRIVMNIKNGEVDIINYGMFPDKKLAEKNPHKAKITKDGEQFIGTDSEGDEANILLVDDSLIVDGVLFTKVK